MITKGFDFENLALVAVVGADSILSLQDFRADEKALYLLEQLRGRVSRREGTGIMAIQTMQAEHPVLQALQSGDRDTFRFQMLEQRKLFGFPPYIRMVQLTVKNSSSEGLHLACRLVARELTACKVTDFTPAIAPAVDRIAGKYIRNIWIKLPRNAGARVLKTAIAKAVNATLAASPSSEIIIDVDPL